MYKLFPENIETLDILCKHKSGYQLLNSSGAMMSCSELLNKYSIPIPPKEYVLVFDAIPSGAVLLLRSSVLSEFTVVPLDPDVPGVGRTRFSCKKIINNRDIFYFYFFKEIVSVPNAVFHWNNLTLSHKAQTE